MGESTGTTASGTLGILSNNLMWLLGSFIFFKWALHFDIDSKPGVKEAVVFSKDLGGDFCGECPKSMCKGGDSIPHSELKILKNIF